MLRTYLGSCWDSLSYLEIPSPWTLLESWWGTLTTFWNLSIQSLQTFADGLLRESCNHRTFYDGSVATTHNHKFICIRTNCKATVTSMIITSSRFRMIFVVKSVNSMEPNMYKWTEVLDWSVGSTNSKDKLSLEFHSRISST